MPQWLQLLLAMVILVAVFRVIRVLARKIEDGVFGRSSTKESHLGNPSVPDFEAILEANRKHLSTFVSVQEQTAAALGVRVRTLSHTDKVRYLHFITGAIDRLSETIPSDLIASRWRSQAPFSYGLRDWSADEVSRIVESYGDRRRAGNFEAGERGRHAMEISLLTAAGKAPEIDFKASCRALAELYLTPQAAGGVATSPPTSPQAPLGESKEDEEILWATDALKAFMYDQEEALRSAGISIEQCSEDQKILYQHFAMGAMARLADEFKDRAKGEAWWLATPLAYALRHWGIDKAEEIAAQYGRRSNLDLFDAAKRGGQAMQVAMKVSAGRAHEIHLQLSRTELASVMFGGGQTAPKTPSGSWS